MLVLSRKVGEAVAIGEDIKVVVTDVRGRTVRIGIEAPTDIRISRVDNLPSGSSGDRAMDGDDDEWRGG